MHVGAADLIGRQTEDFLGWVTPVEVAVLILDVAVQREGEGVGDLAYERTSLFENLNLPPGIDAHEGRGRPARHA